MPRFDPILLTGVRLRDLPDGQYEAVEVPTGSESWDRMAESYKAAGDRLVAAKDSFVYAMHSAPTLFMYRHYIELHLKSLLLDAGQLLDDPQTVPPKHYLQSLWQRVRKLLLKISPESDGAWFERADQIITDFDALDPSSFAFRYPVDNSGAPSLPAPLYVDLKVARRVISELHILLSGASAQIAEYMNVKYEGY